MATPRKNTKQIAFDAEVRAIEEGHRARATHEADVYLVKSDTSDKSYRVTYTVLGYLEDMLHFHCDCKSGQNRQHLPIPCKHATLIGRRLEREGRAVWSDGMFYALNYVHDWVPAQPSDAFSGLPS